MPGVDLSSPLARFLGISIRSGGLCGAREQEPLQVDLRHATTAANL